MTDSTNGIRSTLTVPSLHSTTLSTLTNSNNGLLFNNELVNTSLLSSGQTEDDTEIIGKSITIPNNQICHLSGKIISGTHKIKFECMATNSNNTLTIVFVISESNKSK